MEVSVCPACQLTKYGPHDSIEDCQAQLRSQLIAADFYWKNKFQQDLLAKIGKVNDGNGGTPQG